MRTSQRTARNASMSTVAYPNPLAGASWLSRTGAAGFEVTAPLPAPLLHSLHSALPACFTAVRWPPVTLTLDHSRGCGCGVSVSSPHMLPLSEMQHTGAGLQITHYTLPQLFWLVWISCGLMHFRDSF